MSFTQMELAVAILDIVPQMDAEVVTIRIIMEKLAARFGVDLKTIRTQKAAIKQLVMNSYGHAEELHQSSDAEKENSGNHDSGSRGRLQVSPVKRKPARKANTISDESDNEEDEASEQDDEEEEADDDGDDDSEAQASDSDSDAPKHKRASVSAVFSIARCSDRLLIYFSYCLLIFIITGRANRRQQSEKRQPHRRARRKPHCRPRRSLARLPAQTLPASPR